MEVFCATFLYYYSLSLYFFFLAKESWYKSCSLNVGEIETSLTASSSGPTPTSCGTRLSTKPKCCPTFVCQTVLEDICGFQVIKHWWKLNLIVKLIWQIFLHFTFYFNNTILDESLELTFIEFPVQLSARKKIKWFS
jgi:hypothetical protein